MIYKITLLSVILGLVFSNSELICRDNDSNSGQGFLYLKSIEAELQNWYQTCSPSVVRIVTTPFSAKPNKKSCPLIASGFFVSKDGYIITSADTCCGRGFITVITKDNWEYPAELIAIDKVYNIALVKIDKSELPTLKLGSALNCTPGSVVMSITNPYGLASTFSVGFINGLNRCGFGAGYYNGFIQTSLPINPGDSGSPLFNCQGEVIGIMTAVLVNDSNAGSSATGIFQPQNISFAVPIDMIKNQISNMINSGQPKRSWLGIEVKNPSQDEMRYYKTRADFSGRGIVISKVFPDSPAYLGGLKEGDMIISVNDQVIDDVSDLLFFMAAIDIDKKLKINIIREIGQLEVFLKTRKMPDFILNEKS
ncbi:trypsin-like peptidase domain-containing protein [bacterium]|nr:trypsin-like peptidase domain-containing protein [bacterium]